MPRGSRSKSRRAVDPEAWRAFHGISEEQAAALASRRVEQRRRSDAIAVAAVVERLIVQVEAPVGRLLNEGEIRVRLAREEARVRAENKRCKALTALRRALRAHPFLSFVTEEQMNSALLAKDEDVAEALRLLCLFFREY